MASFVWKRKRRVLGTFSRSLIRTRAEDHCPADVPQFINDTIARTLAGVTSRGRPLFLKMPYYGPRAMEALVRYDSSLVVGILGGSAGTTFDAFQMLWEAKKHGARAALFGRKINNAEHQLTFIQYLRRLADDELEPVEAVKAYHADLERLSIRPRRKLEQDLQPTPTGTSYDSSGGGAARPAERGLPKEPDFSKMTPAEKVQWNLDRWNKILG